MDIKKNRQADGQKEHWTDRRTERRMERQTNRKKNGQTDVQKEEWTDRCTERRDRQENGHKETCIDTQLNYVDNKPTNSLIV